MGRRAAQRSAIVTTTLTLALLVVSVHGSGVGAAEQSTTTTTAAIDYPSALTARLTKEYGDAALAHAIVAGLDADSLARLEARVPLTEVATSPFLRYRPKRVATRDVDGVVVFSFGNRVAADGSLTPGPTNAALAATTKAFVKKHRVPVFAQQEIAKLLKADGVKHVTSIDPTVGPDGKVVYLSTVGVVEQVVDKARSAGVDLGTAGVICFADHAMRCVLTTEAAGLRAAVPKGVVLPRTYDPESSQPWTRDRKSYLVTDLAGRLATL